MDPKPPVSPLRCTLLGDGASDRCLLPVITWLLSKQPGLGERGILSQLADLRDHPAANASLRDRALLAAREFPCDILFIHRDAENQSPELRVQEIEVAARGAAVPAYVPVVPVRMTEAWLLIDELAIRTAADNPHGTADLGIPPLRQLEALPDPKERLKQCLRNASEKRGRRLHQFNRDLPMRIHRVASLIIDYSHLRQLVAFSRFEAATLEALRLLPI